ncbi:MaoC/PaaZ C-terminal domain-containing protein [Paractinoplanes rhizophilus]|jgi:hydroxyacyl-ACP dehydratase HTD2-like protein with hotdog domain|uniref:MaoC/PaaZ C-terminal domain-containing protein n=1 Tax=Paractinoplanes rhizophilus TaxID=1416877 RepID=A0ABW2I4Q3_9ACTN|nr:MaoC/PaaZ C-terminal domain-containing protein [Actinoplanes sp.]
MTSQIFFDDVQEGDQIPTLAITVDATQMFFFSAATYNGHRIHYDRTWAKDVEGYPDILVHGPLQAALLARALTDWAGPGGRLVRYSIQNRASAYPGEELRFVGKVTGTREEDGQTLVDLAIHGEKGEGEVLMPGTATVALPKRAS